MSVGDVSWTLARAAEQHGSRTGVIDGTARIAYRRLASRVASLAYALDGLDVPVGGRVGVLAANSIAHLETSLAIPSAGRVLVGLDHTRSAAALRGLARDAELAVLVTDTARLGLAEALRADVEPGLRIVAIPDASRPGPVPAGVVPYDELVRVVAPAPQPDLRGSELALIAYTAGTTGPPKGVMLSHGNLIANARHNLIATGHGPQNRWLHVCPLFHLAGLANVLPALWVGATNVLLDSWDAATTLRAISEHRITHVALVPAMLARLVEHPDLHGTDLSSLEHVHCVGGPMPVALKRRVLEAFDCDIAQSYGMAETAQTVTHFAPDDQRRAHYEGASWLDSVGAPVIGMQLEIRDRAGARARAGEVGELWVRGPNVMSGYWRQPDATAAALVDGWLRTGDGGWIDERGRVFLVDRANSLVGREPAPSAAVKPGDDTNVIGIPLKRRPDERRPGSS